MLCLPKENSSSGSRMQASHLCCSTFTTGCTMHHIVIWSRRVHKDPGNRMKFYSRSISTDGSRSSTYWWLYQESVSIRYCKNVRCLRLVFTNDCEGQDALAIIVVRESGLGWFGSWWPYWIKEWLQWRKKLPLFSKHLMPRCYYPKSVTRQLHGFSDASEKAYTLELCISEWKIRQAAYTLL